MNYTPLAIPGKLNVECVANYFDIQPEDIFKKTREREILVPRQISVWLDYKEHMEKYHSGGHAKIAKAYGFHRSTVYHCVKTVNNDMALKPYKKLLANIQMEIYGCVRYNIPGFDKHANPIN